MYSIQVTGQNDKSHSYLRKDNLSAFVDHESNTVRQTVASTSNIPARVDYVDFGLDLIWMDNVNRTICCRLRDVHCTGCPRKRNIKTFSFWTRHSGLLKRILKDIFLLIFLPEGNHKWVGTPKDLVAAV